MTPRELNKLDQELSKFITDMTTGMGRPERRRALEWYISGLLMDGGRKTIVSMSSRLVDEENEIEAMRQRLQQCVTVSNWADDELYRRLAHKFEGSFSPEAFILDDTGFAKKGDHSVGVHRQYSGTLGRVDNCQIATSLHVASDDTSGCIGMRLYLPEVWSEDNERRQKAGVPDEIRFQKKWQIGLALLDDALNWGLPPRVMIADAGFGDSTDFRDGLHARNCPYVVGIKNNHLAWPPESNPKPPRNDAKRGRPFTRYRDGNKKPQPLSKIGTSLNFRKYTCPDGRGGAKSGYFAFARVHLAERHTKGRPPSEKMWIIVEWRPAKKEYRYYTSNLPASTAKKELVRLIKLRWRVERDYQEMKGELGLDHFEGRTWRGFHHHAALCAMAHGFLALRRRLFPRRSGRPNVGVSRSVSRPETISLDYQHGAKENPTTHHKENRHLSVVPAPL